MKLNIGAGSTRFDGFVNCDYSDQYSPEYVFDLEKDIWPFEDNSIEEVIAHHVLEHLGDGYFHALKELYRVCKHNATIDIRVPHFRSDNMFHDPTHRRPITHFGLTLFSKAFNDHCEATENAASRLGYYLNIDFEIIKCEHTLDKMHPDYHMIKDWPVERLAGFAYDRCNVFDETHITLRAVKEYDTD